MPRRTYDLSDVPIRDRYDLSYIPIRPVAADDSLSRAVKESGILEFFGAGKLDYPSARTAPEPVSSTGVAGTGGEQVPPVPGPKPGESESPLRTFARKMAEFSAIPGATTGGPAIMAVAATIGEVLSPGVEAMGGEYTADQSLAETGLGLIQNTGRSFARIGPALLSLPEAMARDPVKTVGLMIEGMGEQFAAVYKAISPADSWEEKQEKKEAWRQLYEDPLGPVFAATIAAGGAAGMLKAAGKASQFAKLVRLGSKIEVRAAEMEAQIPTLAPEVKLLAAPAGMGEGFVSRPGLPTTRPLNVNTGLGEPRTLKHRLIKGGQGLGEGFSAETPPVGATRGWLEPAESARVPGAAPPGNFGDFLGRLHAEVLNDAVTPASVASGMPVPPPKWQPFLRSGRFTESPILDARKVPEGAPPSILESASPLAELLVEVTTGNLSKINPVTWAKALYSKTEWARNILHTMETRMGNLPEPRQLISSIRTMMSENNNLAANFAEDFREVGTLLQREGWWPSLVRKHKSVALMKMEEFMQLSPVQEVFRKIGATMKEAGVTTKMPDGSVRSFELSESFLKTGPWRMKRAIAQALWEDAGGLVQSATIATERAIGKGRQPQSARDSYVASILEKTTGRYKVSKTTEGAIEHLLKNQSLGIKTRGEALQFLADQAANNLFRVQGVEMPRIAKFFPEEFRETNPARVIGQYINEAARTLAEVRVFGPEREGLNGLLRTIQEKYPFLYDDASDLADIAMGVIDRTHPLSRTAAKAQRVYANITYGLKIGGGMAPLLQLSQPLISFVPDAGVLRSIKGTLDSMKPTHRAWLRRHGVTGTVAAQKFFAFEPSTRFIDKLPTLQFFRMANKALDYAAASTGDVFARDLHRIANRSLDEAGLIGKQRIKWAQEKLDRHFGIDWTKPIDDQAFVQAAGDYARWTQLHPDATRESKFMNMPQTRWLAMLKRFAYKQTLLSREIIWGEMKRGNVAPALRLAAGGYLGGDLMIRAKDEIRELLSGQPVFHEHEPFWVHVANRYAIIGTMGMISDVGWIRDGDPSKLGLEIVDNIGFLLTPVAMNDAARVGDAMRRGAKNLSTWWLGTEAQQEKLSGKELAIRMSEEMATYFGTYGYHISAQFRSTERESAKNVDVRSKRLTAARKTFWAGNVERAQEIVNEWNDNVDKFPIADKTGEIQYRQIDWYRDVTRPGLEKDFK